MFKIVLNKPKITNRYGVTIEHTVMLDCKTKKYVVVSSIYSNAKRKGDETLVFKCDEHGILESFTEIYSEKPSNHDGVISKLLKDEIALNL